MLTLILLVVLGGGAGLAAVWLVDPRGLSGLLGRFEGRSLRGAPRADTAGRTTPLVPDRTPGPGSASVAPSVLEPPATDRQAPSTGTTTVTVYEAVEVPLEPLPSVPPPGRRDAKRIPAAYTAVEGSYRDVARVPVWRKLVSLVSLLGILLLVGVTLAALAGATIGAIAELVDSAVG